MHLQIRVLDSCAQAQARSAVVCCARIVVRVSLHIATGLVLLGIASRRLEEALGTLASQGLTGNE